MQASPSGRLLTDLVEHEVAALVNESTVAVLKREKKGFERQLQLVPEQYRVLCTDVAVKIDEEVAVPILVVRTKELLESVGRLPCIVVRDLGRDVVRDVGLALFGRQPQLADGLTRPSKLMDVD